MSTAPRPADAPKKHPVYCDDWSCPSLWSCRWAWGRSWPYWRFDQEADERERVRCEARWRNPHRAACFDYERDEPRSWLASAFTPMDGVRMLRPVIPSGFTLHAVDCAGRS